MSAHDAIVVGGGHNGLICAAYLARAGVDVVVVESRDQVGGCASTVAALGARVNVCNCDHLTFRTTPIADELDLATHGLRYLDVEPAQLSLSWTGAAPWVLHHDVAATLDSLRRSHPGEVDGYRRYLAAARPVAELVLELAAAPPSLPTVARTVLDRRARGARTLLAWSRRTAVEVLQAFFTSEALLGPVLTTGPAVWGITGGHPRTGLAAAGYALKHVARVGRPEGGSGRLTDAVAGALTQAGGTLRCGTPVTAIRVEGDRVRGVELASGEVLTA
ncbi:MAG TPA: NAD(P)/FAD-dependent oxidoreductase, partial [Acidimicrobiales bacterium]|nr:NAD(P)/FAD-dependent oxidoreductase [Acidimicrobiales bacterium]